MRWSWVAVVGVWALCSACGNTARDGDEMSSAGSSGSGGAGGAGTGGASGGAGASGGGSGGAAACDDTVLRPEDDPFQTCPNLGPVCRPLCEDVTERMKVAIAGRTIKCMASECMCPGPIEECETRSMQCMLERLATACEDPSADDDCAELEAQCGAPAAGDPSCHALIDGLTEAARAEVDACAVAGCDGGLATCVRSVLMP